MIAPGAAAAAPPRELDPRDLVQRLAEPLQRAYAAAGGAARLTPLSRGPLPDSVTLFRVHAHAGRPVGVLQVSPPRQGGGDDLVQREVQRSRAARAALGPRLGDVILEPLAWFEDERRTYAAYPLCQPLPARRLPRAAARARLRRLLPAWLLEAARLTRREPTAAQVAHDFARPLAAVAEDPRLGAGLRDGARIALERLEAGTWRPSYVLQHADLWEGNVLLWPSRPWWRDGAPRQRFVLIDWRGSRVDGHAVADLLSLAQGLRLAPRALRRELERHAWVLGCSLEDTRGHLLAAIGALGLDLGCFEPRRWADGAERAWGLLLEGLEA